MRQLGYFGAEAPAATSYPALPPPSPEPALPKLDPISAYIRARERVAELQARMEALAPTPSPYGAPNVFVSAPDYSTMKPPEVEPVPVRTVSTGGDWAKLAVVGVVSGVAVWAITSMMRRRRR